MKTQTPNPKGKSRIWVLVFFLFLQIPVIPLAAMGQEVKRGGWSLPDLKGLVPYSIQAKKVNGVEKIIERSLTPDGGHVGGISEDGKVFAYAVGRDRDSPMDPLLLDPDGLERFTEKFRSEDSYMIAEWVSR